MTKLTTKQDFTVFVSVNKANPNGDPNNGNRPREENGYGEMSSVSIKRKIRNQLQYMGESILLKSQDLADDGFKSSQERVFATPGMEAGWLKAGGHKGKIKEITDVVCKEYIDVRLFGLVYASTKKDSFSLSVRGPVTINIARSLDPIEIHSQKISKSLNTNTNKADADKKDSDTFGDFHYVDSAVYRIDINVNPLLAERVGLTVEDVEKLKDAILHMFDNDASNARPAGSMLVERLFWWNHNDKYGDGAINNPKHRVHVEHSNTMRMSNDITDYIITPKVTDTSTFTAYKLTENGFEEEIIKA